MASFNRSLQKQQRLQYLELKDSEIMDIVSLYATSADVAVRDYLLSSGLDITDINKAQKALGLLDAGLLAQRIKLVQPVIDGVLSMTVLSRSQFGQLVSTKQTYDVQKLTEVENEILKRSKGLSTRIWKPDFRKQVLEVADKGFRENKTMFQVAQDISDYMKKGQGFSSAYRLAHTELTEAYSFGKVQSARLWNNDPSAQFKIVIVQRLSPTHAKFDICDTLQGEYDPSRLIPKIPRHPHCNCIEEEKMVPLKTSFSNKGIIDKNFEKWHNKIESNGISKDIIQYF